jgi:hypothetical protein
MAISDSDATCEPYLAHVLNRTIREEICARISRYMRSHTQARIAIKDIVEMPDMQVDRIIRSAQSNQGKLSNVLIKEIPILAEPGVWDAILKAIEVAFQSGSEGRTVNKYAS